MGGDIFEPARSSRAFVFVGFSRRR